MDQEFSVEEIKTFSFTPKNLYFLKLHNDPGKMIIVLRGNLVGEQCRPGPFFMKLRILGDIHKTCISGKIFAFHRSTKDILEHFLF